MLEPGGVAEERGVVELLEGDDPERYLEVPTRAILVVDDTDRNLIAIEAALQPFSARLVAARSGREALSRLLEQDFALILLDVHMPELDGFETARLIRSRERSRETPIIFMTAYDCRPERVIEGYRLGAVDFLFKPIEVEILRAKASVFCALQDRTAELSRKANLLRRAHCFAHERVLEAQRRELEAHSVRIQMEQLAAADRRKDEFLAILAHELRNPLAPLRAAVELIQHDPDRPVAPRIIEALDHQVQHLARLVDDLLDVSRLGAGKLELRIEPVSLDRVVDEAIAACRPLLDSRHHELIRTCTHLGVAVSGDPVRLVQVVSNLITNAARYTPADGRIEVTWGERDGSASLVVSDNGRGIASEVLDRIFEMFVQERAAADGYGGLGIGLSLVQRLVTLHGGRVVARSPGVGQGSTFEVTLPLGERRSVEAVPAPPPAIIAPRGIRAVLVEDQADIRDLVAALLARSGHHVATAADGESGLAMILDLRPDVAIVDVGLPALDGYEVARAVRSRFSRDQMRLVAMTGYCQESDRRRAIEAGFDAHLVKPASASDLLDAITAPRTRW